MGAVWGPPELGSSNLSIRSTARNFGRRHYSWLFFVFELGYYLGTPRSSNGRTRDSGSRNLGSSPSLGTNLNIYFHTYFAARKLRFLGKSA